MGSIVGQDYWWQFYPSRLHGLLWHFRCFRHKMRTSISVPAHLSVLPLKQAVLFPIGSCHLLCIAIWSSSNSSEALRKQAYLGPASTQAEMSCTLVGGSFICQITKWAPNVNAADSASPGSIQVGFSLGKQGSYWVNINQYSSETSLSSWLVLFVRKATTSFLCPRLSTDGGKAHRVLINRTTGSSQKPHLLTVP